MIMQKIELALNDDSDELFYGKVDWRNCIRLYFQPGQSPEVVTRLNQQTTSRIWTSGECKGLMSKFYSFFIDNVLDTRPKLKIHIIQLISCFHLEREMVFYV